MVVGLPPRYPLIMYQPTAAEHDMMKCAEAMAAWTAGWKNY